MNLYSLMRFPDTVRLENQSVLSGEEVFLRGLFELATGHKKTSVAETFGRHPREMICAFSVNQISMNA